MKTDLPECPAHPPKKRRVLEDTNATPDLWLRLWAEDKSLPPSQVARAEREIARRKALTPDVLVGVLTADEGSTPAQVQRLRAAVLGSGVTELRQCGQLPSPVFQAGKEAGAKSVRYRESDREKLVRDCTHVFAAPRGPRATGNEDDVWRAILLARHRKLVVKVILPDGSTEEEA